MADAPAAPVDTAVRYVHPEAARFFASCPWARQIPIFGEAVEGFGWRMVIALGGSYLFCKGIADQILTNQTFAMMRVRYGISADRYQRLYPISTMGWSIKAFSAMMCDGFAFLGYTKRWYMFVSCVAGAVFALVYGLLPAKASSADTAAAFIFLSCYGKANVDILSEGHYSRLMRGNPKPGPALIGCIWWMIMVGAIIATVMNGPLADLGKPQISIFVSAALQFLTAFIFLFNWYGEKKNRVQRSEDALYMLEETRKERERLGLATGADDLGVNAPAPEKKPYPEHSSAEDAEAAVQDALGDELVQSHYSEEDNGDDEAEVYYGEPPVPCLFGVFEMNKEVISDNWRIFAYSIVITCAVVAMLCGNILADTLGLLIICVVVSTICCSLSFWALPSIIARTNVFAYLNTVVYIHAVSPLQTFYMNSNKCKGDFPNFTFTFYSTIAGVIGNIAGLVGVAAFKYLFSKQNYQVTYVVTTVLQVLGAIFDIIMVKRWNEYIGVPDHAMYIWGDAVVQQIVYMLGFMPLVVLMSRLCPRGSESVVYALMAGFSNLGQTTASSIAAIIMEYGWPVFAENDKCNYENLPWLVFVCSVMTPLLAIPLSFMLPIARIIDDVDIDGNVVRAQVDKKVVAEEVLTEHTDSERGPLSETREGKE
ncbi:putative mitochondrial folate/biopterin transporter [Leptomonas pyrrhocoris]|uniref:Putative mitochondrial folate/biopterin transporter n=1 Tax=Leptomonas pyrrhocoris TaxID=157538 RepID=A0A0M9FU64_LEPPY|nr:putative mitochondrial folate/biopterin transporter [Leptomonas pyrrhocoris]XP_015654375.1 putative mitochondrial folate/biopterin transporter [Leptomonas pyrrhocoris]XP_015654376.1 putative mitochondrial folate/biopterin transporter [Leptomonas pyrrhocoris]KPA75935.1 putative mitochondrial folate/biopterin transporter [Leptomonas pyrrhocoris]KPA75936.1 putative mitochondrial folate/biopterin transporter [Leptomonas pyrrhocoris]KPA75937.1 putative mitochondrial folate/biopterin transporter |eukprot:XP_015654374.1 putative mitochondrial folate/biopterin transporter [Leptomonas pyrrhocoris]